MKAGPTQRERETGWGTANKKRYTVKMQKAPVGKSHRWRAEGRKSGEHTVLWADTQSSSCCYRWNGGGSLAQRRQPQSVTCRVGQLQPFLSRRHGRRGVMRLALIHRPEGPELNRSVRDASEPDIAGAGKLWHSGKIALTPSWLTPAGGRGGGALMCSLSF